MSCVQVEYIWDWMKVTKMNNGTQFAASQKDKKRVPKHLRNSRRGLCEVVRHLASPILTVLIRT